MLNRAIIRGFVADDPFIRSTERGKVARLRVATIEHLPSRDGVSVREHTEWHTISLWGDAADVADLHIRVGSPVEIEGALRTREWEDRMGKFHRESEIVANRVTILDSIEGYALPRSIAELKAQLYPTKRVSSPTQQEVKAPSDDPDELPF